MSSRYLDEFEQQVLQDLSRRAQKAGMSVWAYAVHTGNGVYMRVGATFRALYDHDWCMEVLTRGMRVRGSTFVVSDADAFDAR